jgi:hypothetical protein
MTDCGRHCAAQECTQPAVVALFAGIFSSGADRLWASANVVGQKANEAQSWRGKIFYPRFLRTRFHTASAYSG